MREEELMKQINGELKKDKEKCIKELSVESDQNKIEKNIDKFEKYFQEENDADSTGDEWESIDEPLSTRMQLLERTSERLTSLRNNYLGVFKRLILGFCLLLYVVYFCYAMKYNSSDEGSTILITCTCFFVLYHFHSLLKKYAYPRLSKVLRPFTKRVKRYYKTLNLVALFTIYISVGVLVAYDVGWGNGTVYNLVSFAGLLVYVTLMFVNSISPARIRWRTVAWGFALQITFAVIILRWPFGYHILKWIGDKVTMFLDFADVGCRFIFGPDFKDHFFAMKILPTIIFVSSVISILFYLGTMQWIIMRMSGLMENLMNTTAGESFSAAGNIFIGMSETPLAIKPLLPRMTDSELHGVMTSGFATIAGACMAAYIGFGVPANHLLSASVMSAPAALAISKLVHPETKKTKTSSKQIKDFLKEKSDNSVVDAASSGAASALILVGLVCANLLAFVSLLEVVNSALRWIGNRVGMVRNLTFQFICSYVLWPFALVMGVDVGDCRKVAQLIGVKTFVNEFVAYLELKDLLDNRILLDTHEAGNGSWSWSKSGEDILLHHIDRNATLFGGVIHDRSAVISTYALCGFSNFGSVGITIGVFTALLPKKNPRLASLVLSAMIAGNVACLVTACIAGLFYNPTR